MKFIRLTAYLFAILAAVSIITGKGVFTLGWELKQAVASYFIENKVEQIVRQYKNRLSDTIIEEELPADRLEKPAPGNTARLPKTKPQPALTVESKIKSFEDELSAALEPDGLPDAAPAPIGPPSVALTPGDPEPDNGPLTADQALKILQALKANQPKE